MAGFKDKDLMKDTGGKTKVQKDYGGEHKRPPRLQQRKQQRNRFLKKEDKLDMNIESTENQETKKFNGEQLDLQIGDNGQVYVQDEPSKKSVMTFSDLVNIPSQVKDIRDYDDFNTAINNSMNDDTRYNIQLNEQNDNINNIQMDEFDFKDDDAPEMQQADVSNDDLILSDEQEQSEESNPFDDLFNKEETSEEETTEQNNTKEETSEESTEQQSKQNESDKEEKTEQSNDPIDEYLNMEIDDSKLSQQNKKKLDSFTSQQMDAFKKFLYQKKNSQE